MAFVICHLQTPSQVDNLMVRSFSKKVLLILDLYSESIVEDAEDEEDGEELHSATSPQPDKSNSELVN
jgi:hypothetical protein